MMSRKTNITGVKHLSVSLNSRNDKGGIVKRYIVNWQTDKPKSKSFYFGERVNIKDAFILACIFMIENKITKLTIEECIDIFNSQEHAVKFGDH